MRLPLPFACELLPWKLEFLDGLMEASNYPEISRYMAPEFPCPYNETTGLAFLMQAMNDHPTQAFAIVVSKHIAGAIAVQPKKEFKLPAAELGYWLSPPYWNKGIATIAIGEILKYSFVTWNIEYVYARAHPANQASLKILLKNGFVKIEDETLLSQEKKNMRQELLYIRYKSGRPPKNI